MLNESEITETEAIFLTLDSGKCIDEHCNELIEHVMKSFDMYCYLKWLLFRWVHIRNNKDHLPKRRVSLDKCVIRQRKKRKGDWYCPNCGDLQFKHNVNCRICGAPNPFSNSFKTYYQIDLIPLFFLTFQPYLQGVFYLYLVTLNFLIYL